MAVVGHCGSGKTSLVAALLGEMVTLSGTVSVKVSLTTGMRTRLHMLSDQCFSYFA